MECEHTDNDGDITGVIDDRDALFMVTTVDSNHESAIIVEPEVNSVSRMEVDTGATVSIASQNTWKQYFPGTTLEKLDTLLKTYTGETPSVRENASLGEVQDTNTGVTAASRGRARTLTAWSKLAVSSSFGLGSSEVSTNRTGISSGTVW